MLTYAIEQAVEYRHTLYMRPCLCVTTVSASLPVFTTVSHIYVYASLPVCYYCICVRKLTVLCYNSVRSISKKLTHADIC
jgi:hypothetical protein